MKVLIIGLGSIAQKHLTALRTIKQDVKVFALRSGVKNRDDNNVISIYDLKEVDVSEFSFAVISNPTSEHYGTLKLLLNYSIPLFIEKPLFSDISQDMTQLVEAYTNRDIPTYVACNLRFLECIQRLKKLLDGEIINEVNVYCGSYLPDWRPNQNYKDTYSANKELGGGVHIDLIHELDYLYWLFGSPNDTISYFSNTSSLEITAYDYANYLWKYNTFNANIVLNYYRRQSKRTIEVLTANNTFVVDLLQNNIRKNDELIFSSDRRVIDTYLSQMEFFISNIRTGKLKFNPINEAYEILKLCIQD